MNSRSKPKWNPKQQQTIERMEKGTAQHGSVEAWLKWEKENNPNFQERKLEETSC